ncbi:MAG: hypothetical protein BHW10_06790 [Clostridium sp. CAG:307_30_263]|nr:MAG: hypothetical protein BHW10_06790 [Clostridium sp. CAG:307_30_263]
MEQEIISFYQYLISKKGKEVHLSNDLCFKYAMQNQEVASLVLNTLGFIVKPQDITIPMILNSKIIMKIYHLK